MKIDLNANVNISHPIGEHLPECLRLINHKLHQIMSAISEFAAKQNTHNDAIDAAVTGLTGDIKALNDKIAELQASAGVITPEDQALLDAIDTRGQSIADKLAALDAQTENAPTPPVE